MTNCYACGGPIGEDALSTADDIEDNLAATRAGWEACRIELEEIRARAEYMAEQYGREPLIGGLVASVLRAAIQAPSREDATSARCSGE